MAYIGSCPNGSLNTPASRLLLSRLGGIRKVQSANALIYRAQKLSHRGAVRQSQRI